MGISPKGADESLGKSLHIIVQTPVPSRSSNMPTRAGSARRPDVLVYRLHDSAEFCRIPATFCKVSVMKIVIAGGSGFLGSPLAEMYAEDGHDVRVLTRSLESGRDAARSRHGRPWHHAGRLEARRQQPGRGPRRSKAPTRVINLSGESLGVEAVVGRRPRSGCRDSRILATRSLAAAIRAARRAAGGSHQRQRRRVLRAVRRPAAHRERPARHRFPGDSSASTGKKEARQAERARDARRPAPDGHRPRTIGRRACRR